MGDRYAAESTEYRQPERQPSRIVPRLLISMLVILAMAGISFGLILYFRDQPDLTKPPASSGPLRILPEEEMPKAPAITPASPAPAATAAKPPAGQPAKPSKAHAGIAAAAVLEKFLAASTLDERLPFIDTRLSRAELEKTVLAKPMPPNPRVAQDIQETNPTDGSTDIFYNVDFEIAGGKDSPQVILLRARPDGEFKVIVDPFLDTFGGRLAAYAAAPSEKTASFQVVISAVAQTTSDRNVPNYENKLRLKLMPRDNEKEIANAYFTKHSKIGEMLTTDDSGFRYGQARAARVTLRWNKEEDPAIPFLEATEIKEFRWNP